ncbi:hypothetical protein G6F65_022723 [Rhizopus arrhizus]|nr:hypothetical protein G6F65_022723 [Rhizopus arrhizus]
MPPSRSPVNPAAPSARSARSRWTSPVAACWPASCPATAMPTTPRSAPPTRCISVSSAMAWWSGCTSCWAWAVPSCSIRATCCGSNRGASAGNHSSRAPG